MSPPHMRSPAPRASGMMTKKKSAVQPKQDPAAATREELAKWDAEEAERLETSAKDIIECDDVLSLFAKSWRQIIAGEEKNAKLLYLIATSRLFTKCMNAAIKGPSSAGKSEIRRQVLDFFPPEEVVSFTTLSEKALLYFEDDFAHKVLSMGEAGGTEEQSLQDYLLRELISEGRLRYPVVQMGKGGLSTVIIEKSGPVAFMVTTTRAALHAENETRMLSLEVDDSDKQTANVLGKVAQMVGMNADKATVDYEPWRNYQRWLAAGNCTVVVPFAEKLACLIPPRSVRLRRDFAQVLLAIKAHALLHRRHRPVDARGQIVADIDQDYRTVAELMGSIVAEASGAGIEKEVQETIDAVTTATGGLTSEEGATADKIAKLLRLDRSSAWRRLNKAQFKGFIVNLETRHRQPGRYRVTNQEVEIEELLPSPTALAAECTPLAIDAHAQSARQTFENKEKNDCTADCKPHAIAKPLTDIEKVPPIARLHGLHGGIGEERARCPQCGEPGKLVEASDGTHTAWLHRECLDAWAANGWPELPASLDRRTG